MKEEKELYDSFKRNQLKKLLLSIIKNLFYAKLKNQQMKIVKNHEKKNGSA